MTGCTIDTANKEFTIQNGFNIAVSEGDSISITLGPIINPIT